MNHSVANDKDSIVVTNGRHCVLTMVPPDLIKQELQTSVAANCKELVFQGKAKTDEAQFVMIEKACHGTEVHDSLLH